MKKDKIKLSAELRFRAKTNKQNPLPYDPTNLKDTIEKLNIAQSQKIEALEKRLRRLELHESNVRDEPEPDLVGDIEALLKKGDK